MQYLLLVLIVAYLVYQWQRKPSPETRMPAGSMDVQQARDILGVTDAASPADVQTAYQNLIKRLHPDAGGSDYLTQQVVAAKKVLEAQHERA